MPGRPSFRRAHAPARGSPELVEALEEAAGRRRATAGRWRRRDSSSTAPSACGASAPSSPGTLWSGSIGEGDELAAEPARARGTGAQRPGARPPGRARAEAGQRVALSLPGVERDELAPRRRARRARRLPGQLPPRRALDGARADRRTDARVHVHHGTAEHYARLVRVGERYAQLRLTTPAVAARGDRVVLRDRTTVGGGIVLDPAPPRQPSEERLALLERGEPASIVLAALDRLARAVARGPISPGARAPRSQRARPGPGGGRSGLGDWYTTPEWLDELTRTRSGAARGARGVLSARSRHTRRRAPADATVGMRHFCHSCRSSGAAPKRSHRERAPSSATARPQAEAFESELAAGGLNPTQPERPGARRLPRARGPPVRLGDGSYDRHCRLRRGEADRRRGVRGRQARSPSPASATSPGSAARPPSSCSNASTPTA